MINENMSPSLPDKKDGHVIGSILSGHERITPATVLKMLDLVRTRCEEKGLAPSTITKKLQNLERVLRKINYLTHKDISRFFTMHRDRRTGRPLGPAGKNNYREEIRWLFVQVFSMAIPSALVQLLKKEPLATRGARVDRDDFDRLMMYAPSALHVLAFRLCLTGGFRPHELLSLKIAHVEFRNDGFSIIHLPAENAAVSSKRNKTGGRPVPLSGPVDNELRVYVTHLLQKGGGPSSRLFPWKSGTLSSEFHRMKRRFAASPADDGYGRPFPWRLYDLRHTAATAFASQGIRDHVFKLIMGWSPSSRMADVYTHLEARDLASWFAT